MRLGRDVAVDLLRERFEEKMWGYDCGFDPIGRDIAGADVAGGKA